MSFRGPEGFASKCAGTDEALAAAEAFVLAPDEVYLLQDGQVVRLSDGATALEDVTRLWGWAGGCLYYAAPAAGVARWDGQRSAVLRREPAASVQLAGQMLAVLDPDTHTWEYASLSEMTR